MSIEINELVVSYNQVVSCGTGSITMVLACNRIQKILFLTEAAVNNLYKYEF